MFKVWIKLALNLTLAIAFVLGGDEVNAETPSYRFFFDDDIELQLNNRNTACLGNLTIARVKMNDGPAWIGPRDQSGQPGKRKSEFNFWAKLKILSRSMQEVDTASKSVIEVHYGRVSESAKMIHPSKAEFDSKQYYVKICVSNSGVNFLIPMEVPHSEYDEWERQRNYNGINQK